MLKYNLDHIYTIFLPLFCSLPLAALINNKIFCVHGGISPQCKNIENINNINRFIDISVSGLLCDLTWGDPLPNNSYFSISTRGIGHCFGLEASTEFFLKNNIELIIRAHQLMQDGFSYTHNNKVLTIFSAPNYEKISKNKAAYVVIDENLNHKIIKFSAALPLKKIEKLKSFIY